MDLSSYGYGYFVYCNDVNDNAAEEYKAILENNEFTVTYSESEELYVALDKDNLIELYFYLDSSNLIIAINEHVEPVSWPSELISQYFDGASVPQVEGIDSYYIDDSNMEEYGLVISFASDDSTLEDTYKQTLINAGFTVEFDADWDGDMATDTDKKVTVGWYLLEGNFYVQVFPYSELVIEDNVLDFSTDTLITASSNDEVTWENGNYKMVVTKGSSTSNVGNGTYLSNPLRLYSGQHVVLSWGSETVSTIEINLSSQNGKSDLSTISNIVGGTISIEGDVATITVNEGVSFIEFDIVIQGSYRQCHISSIVFNA